MSDFQAISKPIARKSHTCCECGGSIAPGKQYQLVAGSWEGVMWSFKTCSPCVEAREWATDQPEWGGDGEFLYYFGMLEEDLSNLAVEISTGDGRRFKTYRLQALMNNRRTANRAQRKAA